VYLSGKYLLMNTTGVRTAIIGCGNLGRALATGMADSGMDPALIAVTRRNTAAIAHLAERGIHTGTDNAAAAAGAQVVILAVKPYNADAILREIAPVIDPTRHMVVSVITGITLSHIGSHLPKGTPLFRAMPNTAADVKQSLTCVCQARATAAQTEVVHGIFASLGTVIAINEELMEAATVMGACGIAYVMRFIRAMVQGGIEIGFDAKTASAIVQQTVKGASELLMARGSHPESEIDKVTTPKGCTIAGLNEMEHHGFSSALIKGIKASYERIEPV
jgi:pyrroline-5-carboxylate reductase